jgi:2-polyprenyl-3-methyl-5-hydroxy-6-metoxy-1,4-benzoquinol methylase
LSWKEKFYSSYTSTQACHLYGETSLEAIRREFPVWKSYFGLSLPEDKEAVILDAGCGNGGFVYFLLSQGYNQTVGVDISREQIEEAKRLGIHNALCADLLDFLEEKKKIYDAIFARDVIEHFTKDELLELLESFFHALKSGGRLIIQTPNLESPFGTGYRYSDFTHEVGFTRTSLAQVLRVIGFHELSFYPTGPVPKGLKSTVRFLLWKLIEGTLRFYMLVETGSSQGIFTQNLIAVARKR